MSEKFGAYIVYELLGQGGMATVHRAESQSAAGFRKRVALKRLLPQLAQDPEVVESFAREAKLASHLRHANIAQTYDLGIAEGAYFIAMELVVGPTLRQLVRQAATAAGAIPIKVALDIAIQVCGALDYAHGLRDEAGKSLGIVHRDVSPANIIVSSTGIVKLIDFGLAKVSAGRNTQTGILKGKLGYMAPEYTLGQLDARADLFAVGVILHELLTGRRLFDHQNDYEIVNMLRAMPIQPPSRWSSDVGLELDDIVMTALQRDPTKRWQSAAALRSALTNVVRERGISLTPIDLATWVEWAFSQQPRREESVLARVIGSLGDPSDPAVTKAPERGSSVLEIESVDLMLATPAPEISKPKPDPDPKPKPKPKPKPQPDPQPDPDPDPDPTIRDRAITSAATRPRLPIAPQQPLWPIVAIVAAVLAAAGAAIYFLLLR